MIDWHCPELIPQRNNLKGLTSEDLPQEIAGKLIQILILILMNLSYLRGTRTIVIRMTA